MEPCFVPSPLWAKTLAFNAQLYKTVLCDVFIRRGRCHDECSFAHSRQELRERPQLERTSYCKLWSRGRCRDLHCNFAHGEEELRRAFLYKTQLCKHYACGHCQKGELCRHAHGETELRSSQQGTRLTHDAMGSDASPAKVRLPSGSESGERCYVEV
jgi:hypothetical protein